MGLTSFEWLTIAYLVGAVNLALSRRLWRALSWAAAGLALVVSVPLIPIAVRVWFPMVYLIFGYWLPALFVPMPLDPHFERWLVTADRKLLAGREGRRVPRSLVPLLELAYLLCYPMVPAGLAFTIARGNVHDIERFWTTVLLAGFACYATLPWTASRPPRIARDELASGVAAVNAYVLGRASHQLTTFPSGHAAVATAVALSVWSISSVAGLGFAIVAAAVAVAAVTGRYHFLIDVVAGVPVGVVAWAATRLLL
jgi:hypothetical protein